MNGVPGPIRAFLGTDTPRAWVDEACRRLPELLLDHANCELKAASTALAFIYRYPDRTGLAQQMSRLAREELRHFEQVRKIMERRSIPFRRLSASRYAGQLRASVREGEPQRLLDMLITGAFIEARSCERFAALAPHLPDDLARYYGGLLSSEARHFEQYLRFAASECGATEDEVAGRVAELRRVEADLISRTDAQFRFHSGPPAESAVA